MPHPKFSDRPRVQRAMEEYHGLTEQRIRRTRTAESVGDVLEAAGFEFTGERGSSDEWIQRDAQATVRVKAETQWEFSRGQLSESGSTALELEQFLERERLL